MNPLKAPYYGPFARVEVDNKNLINIYLLIREWLSKSKAYKRL